MSPRALAILALSTTLLCLTSIFVLDRPIAEGLRAAGWEHAWLFRRPLELLDTMSGILWFRYAVALGCAVIAMVLWLAKRRHAAVGLAFAAAVQVVCIVALGHAKLLFGRLRPFQLLETGGWDHAWFAGGTSFPSGHAAFYAGLCLPLAVTFPRLRWLALTLIGYVALARIVDAAHFLGDVTGSIAFAAVSTLVGCVLLADPLRLTHSGQSTPTRRSAT